MAGVIGFDTDGFFSPPAVHHHQSKPVIDVVLDVETTGLNECAGQVLTLGWALRFEDEIHSGEILIRPDMERIEQQGEVELNEALAINGLELEQIAEHPTPYHQAMRQLRVALNRVHHSRITDNCRFRAYNVAFDWRFINTLPESGWVVERMPSSATWCIMELASRKWGEYSSYHGSYRWMRLVDAFSRLDWSDESKEQAAPMLDAAHNAEADACMALLVLEQLQRDGDA
jgi:DNA polymerase III epsilon subunit-like protein